MWGPRALLDLGPPSISTDDLRSAGVWRCSLPTEAKLYNAPVHTASAHISFSLKDSTTRSVLITWSRHRTKHAQKAKPGGVTDEQICDWIKTYQRICGAKLHRNEASRCSMHGMQHKYRAAVHYQGAAANVCVLLITTGLSCVRSVGHI